MHTTGDAIIVTAIIAGILGYLFLKSRERRHRLDILHAERVAAMDKGIPLPELPIESSFRLEVVPPDPRAEARTVLLIGIVFAALGGGAMIAAAVMAERGGLWVLPLPLVLMGIGMMLFYFLSSEEPAPRS